MNTNIVPAVTLAALLIVLSFVVGTSAVVAYETPSAMAVETPGSQSPLETTADRYTDRFGDRTSTTTGVGAPNYQSGAIELNEPIETGSENVIVEVTSLEAVEEPAWLSVENVDNDDEPQEFIVDEGSQKVVSVDVLGGVQAGDTIEVRLAATDDFTNILDVESTTVETGGNEPIAAFDWQPRVADVGRQVAFDASSSMAESDDIVEYRWDFTGNGEFDEVTKRANAQHIFEEAGEMQVSLVVENDVGLTHEKTKVVTVEATDPPEAVLSNLSVAGQTPGVTIAPDEPVGVSVSVTNGGETVGMFDVTLTIVNAVTESRTTSSLGAGEDETVTFDDVTRNLGPGEYMMEVTSGTATVSGELTVEATDDGPADGGDTTERAGDEGDGGLPLTAILVVIGGGILALLGVYTLRRKDDRTGQEGSGTGTEPDTPSATPPQPAPAGDDTSEEGIRIESKLEIANTRLDDARQVWNVSDYDSALDLCQDAREVAESARDIARDEAPGALDDIEATLREVERLEDEVRTERDTYQQATSQLDSATEQLNTAASQIETRPEAALTRFDDAETALDEAAQQIEGYTFPTVADRIQRLRDRCDDLRGRVTDHDTVGAPERIPPVPQLSLTYDSIEKGDPVGGGGNAEVYHATARTDSGTVAITLREPRMDGTLHTDTVEEMMEGAETWAKLDDHDHVVSVIDYGPEPLPWIATEHMNAGHLGDRAGGLPFDQALWTAAVTTEAVRHAHRYGVTHLDLHPGNVLFRSAEGAWDVPKVADWGLPRAVDSAPTPYAAPEQVDDSYGPTDDITDIYQLGAVLYELFTGQPPFTDEPEHARDPRLTETPPAPSEVTDLPEEVDEILIAALAPEKSDRYESVLYLRDALQALQE